MVNTCGREVVERIGEYQTSLAGCQRLLGELGVPGSTTAGGRPGLGVQLEGHSPSAGWRFRPDPPVAGRGTGPADQRPRSGPGHRVAGRARIYQHGEVEKYNKRGNHLGAFDPITGEQTKDPDPKRNVEP